MAACSLPLTGHACDGEPRVPLILRLPRAQREGHAKYYDTLRGPTHSVSTTKHHARPGAADHPVDAGRTLPVAAQPRGRRRSAFGTAPSKRKPAAVAATATSLPPSGLRITRIAAATRHGGCERRRHGEYRRRDVTAWGGTSTTPSWPGWRTMAGRSIHASRRRGRTRSVRVERSPTICISSGYSSESSWFDGQLSVRGQMAKTDTFW
jgi:hypothetical protein